MDLCNPILTPIEERLKLEKDNSDKLVDYKNFRRMIRSLGYLTSIRPNIVFGVELVSRLMESSCQSHLQASKHILQYIKGMQSGGFFYAYINKIKLVGYTHSNWAGDVEKQKSTSGYAFLISGVFSWSSKKQHEVLC